MGEELGTESTPKCGGCKCGKCPLPGHNLSFREEQDASFGMNGDVPILKKELDCSNDSTSLPDVQKPQVRSPAEAGSSDTAAAALATAATLP